MSTFFLGETMEDHKQTALTVCAPCHGPGSWPQSIDPTCKLKRLQQQQDTALPRTGRAAHLFQQSRAYLRCENSCLCTNCCWQMWPHTKWNSDSELAHLSHLQDLEHRDRFADYRLYYYVSTI